MSKKNYGPKILVLDIETAPILAQVWKIWDENIGIEQIKSDWHLLSWAAKWLGEKKVYYMDQRNEKDITDDKRILKGIWKLLDEADVVITHNGKAFDTKKLNARFVLNGLKPPSSFKQIDTLLIARKHFGFTSNKLAYLSSKLCTKYKKHKHAKFSGFALWSECLNGNRAAWNEMKTYNIYDVLSLEELYHKLQAWDNTINFNLYRAPGSPEQCNCGSANIRRNGHTYGSKGKYQRYACGDCGAEIKAGQNLLPKAMREVLKNRTVR